MFVFMIALIIWLWVSGFILTLAIFADDGINTTVNSVLAAIFWPIIIIPGFVWEILKDDWDILRRNR